MKRAGDAEYLHLDIAALMVPVGNNASQFLASGKALENSLTLTPLTGKSLGQDAINNDRANHKLA